MEKEQTTAVSRTTLSPEDYAKNGPARYPMIHGRRLKDSLTLAQVTTTIVETPIRKAQSGVILLTHKQDGNIVKFCLSLVPPHIPQSRPALEIYQTPGFLQSPISNSQIMNTIEERQTNMKELYFTNLNRQQKNQRNVPQTVSKNTNFELDMTVTGIIQFTLQEARRSQSRK